MILDRIIEAKRDEVALARSRVSAEELRAGDLWEQPRRGFAKAIADSPGRCIIAEIKKASPSKGVIRADFDAAAHAASYQRAGATCLSVLTDGPFFEGSLADLRAVRESSSLPLLRKDFTIDRYQITEARAAGADAVLLIVAVLEQDLFCELLAAAHDEGLDVLSEVHDQDELERALEAGASLVGINNRNLQTFETSTEVTRRLVPLAGGRAVLVSESGLSDPAELGQLEDLGVKGFLIGEAFMAARDPGSALARMFER
ncbi:MAG: indole-3-glycerol phosphate synthase TrpC [Deltaproteobacteria bacterium]